MLPKADVDPEELEMTKTLTEELAKTVRHGRLQGHEQAKLRELVEAKVAGKRGPARPGARPGAQPDGRAQEERRRSAAGGSRTAAEESGTE